MPRGGSDRELTRARGLDSEERRACLSLLARHPSRSPAMARKTPEERAAISRANGGKSRGPTSESGKSASKANGLEHGMAAKVLPMPGEVDPEVAAREHSWREAYNPRSPMAHHQLNECVPATLLADRCQAAYDAAVAKQITR